MIPDRKSSEKIQSNNYKIKFLSTFLNNKLNIKIEEDIILKYSEILSQKNTLFEEVISIEKT